jgi:alpha-L-arabinofuranosidase
MFKKPSLASVIIAGLVFGARAHRASPPPAAPPETLTATIDTSARRPPISKYMYGQFIEHLGDLINRGLWAEMIDDRKFYYDINSKPEPPAPPSFFRRKINHWRPVGGDEFVTMDRDRPYTGEHTPRIKLDAKEPHGIAQTGLALRSSKSYTGRVILAGSRSAKVSVTLIWGADAAARETVTLPPLHAAYSKYHFKFSPKADSDDGRIEITGTGTGSFHIGAVSLMPADNIQGFRADTVALLKQLHSGIYRFPGGNFVSNFEWRDAIGDIDQRPPRWDYAWSWVQPNDVGIDEFMVLCKLLGVEPYITVNAGFGDAISAEYLVAYANGPATSTMGRLRAANGHPAPYHIRWWGIGNEMYGPWQFGYMPLNQFEIKHNLFARAMRNADPSIKLIASGATPDEMTVNGIAMKVVGKEIPDFGSPADWDGGMFQHCLENMDVMSEHFYTYDGQRYSLEEGKRVKVTEPLVDWCRRPANRVLEKVEAYEDYDQRIPALKEKRVTMNIDEYAYVPVRPNLKNAISLAWALQEMFRHTDLITMAAHTMGTGCLDIKPTESAMNTVGMMYKLYRDHYGTVPVEVTGNSPQPPPAYPVGGDQPKVNAGSATYPLDVSAALSADGKLLTVAVINPTESEHALELGVKGIELSGAGKLWLMTGPGPDSATGLGHSEVDVKESALTEVPRSLSVPPVSISIYQFARQ